MGQTELTVYFGRAVHDDAVVGNAYDFDGFDYTVPPGADNYAGIDERLESNSAQATGAFT